MRKRTVLSALVVAVAFSGTGAAQNMPMMQGQGWGYGQSYGMSCAGAGGHTEGMLAYYKTELGITSAQENVWNPFSDALRAQWQDMANHPVMQSGIWNGARGGWGMMGQPSGNIVAAQSLPDALDARIAWAQTHLSDMKALSVAAKPLYATFSDAQKAKADQMLGMPMCGF